MMMMILVVEMASLASITNGEMRQLRKIHAYSFKHNSENGDANGKTMTEN